LKELLECLGLPGVQRGGFPAFFHPDLEPDFQAVRAFPLIQIIADDHAIIDDSRPVIMPVSVPFPVVFLIHFPGLSLVRAGVYGRRAAGLGPGAMALR
jgi:hypothetical protein